MTKLEVAIKAGVCAGDVLMDNYGKVHETKNKESLRDVVSEIDKLSEEKVISILQDYDNECTILTEESGIIGKNSNSLWIVDALDGTVNYIHNFPLFSVSISYWEKNEPQVGVVYNPYSKEIFYAEKGSGSFMNQQRLHVNRSFRFRYKLNGIFRQGL